MSQAQNFLEAYNLRQPIGEDEHERAVADLADWLTEATRTGSISREEQEQYSFPDGSSCTITYKKPTDDDGEEENYELEATLDPAPAV